MIPEIGIFLSLLLLIFVAYKGYSVIFFAPIMALLAASFSGLSLLPTYTEIFLPNLANYAKLYFPFFLLGAVFGKAMELSGAAQSIAVFIVNKIGTSRAILAVVLACAILTYGGVSLFVVAFAVYPFAAALFKEANVPKRFLPATIALGSFTFSMDAIPGSLQIQNAIPMKYFNTDLYAAPVFGMIGAVFIFGGGMAYLEWQRRKAIAAGEGYGTGHKEEPQALDKDSLPSFWLSVLPLISVLALTLILQKVVFLNWDIASWITQPPYNVAKGGILGTMNNWALIIALFLGIVLALVINPKKLKGNVAPAINAGAIGSLLAVMNTASEVGYGNVVKTLPGFQSISDALLSIKGGGSPLLSEAVTVNALSGMTGSGSGGMSIALEAFSKQYIAWADSIGMNYELLHRVAAMSAGGFDTLPHNGAVITLLAVTGLTHKQAYKHIFAITVMKACCPFVVIFLQSLFHFV